MIHLNTPYHTGTYFVRFLLELHPGVRFWRHSTSSIRGKRFLEWQNQYKDGDISRAELFALLKGILPEDPDWTRQHARNLKYCLRPKLPIAHFLLKNHISFQEQFFYPDIPTVITIRDPLLSVLTCLRRHGRDPAVQVVSVFHQLATNPPENVFYFCTDLWAKDRQKAFDLFEYLGLETTLEVARCVFDWPAINTSAACQTKSPKAKYEKARNMLIHDNEIHPLLRGWAKKLQKPEIQDFMESLGYRNLSWFLK